MAKGFLPSHFLATIMGYIYRHTDCWDGFMKNSVQMGSGAMMYIPSSIKIGSSHSKVDGVGYTDSISIA
jgi:hypothetical protein